MSTRVSSRSHADLEESVARCFAPHPEPAQRVGLEIELIPDALSYGLREDVGNDVAVSLEPGGQVELSLPPRPTCADAVRDGLRAVNRARLIAARRNVTLQLVGVNPARDWYHVPLHRPTPRYLAMQQLFDEVGQDGRRMMRTTAALQIGIDLHPGQAGREQWLVANLTGPALSVAFGNSPAGRSRTAIWRGVDLRRTGYDGRHVDPLDPVGAYTAFATAAEPFPIPQAGDPAYHLSTLFPPVRPRGGYLELRFLDAQPVDRIQHAVRTVAALLYDPTARREARAMLSPLLDDLDSAWAAAAAGRSPHVEDLLAIAAAGARRLARTCPTRLAS